jgi:hypothetical protein
LDVTVVAVTRIRRRALFALVAVIATLSIAHSSADGQEPWLPPTSRDVPNMAVFGTNVLLGGLTAAARALVDGHDPARAFAFGALGGAVHFAGKHVGPVSGFPGGIPGVVLSATGTAVVSNAGRGAGLLDELYVPVGPVRVRITPRAPRKVYLAINVFETGILARSLARDGMAVDWDLSASTGTFAFVTRNRHIRMPDGELVQGVASAPTIVVSTFSTDQSRTVRHEFVHVQQQWFLDEAWGRPIERYLRARIPGGARIPRWLEIGVVPVAFVWVETALFGSDGPVRRLAESEAEMLER